LASLAAIVIRYKTLVVFFWVVLTVTGVVTIRKTVARLDYTYATPGEPGYIANLHILERFRMDAAFEPTIAVMHLPVRATMLTATGRAIAARTFADASRAGLVATADYETTRDSKLISRDGRMTWALINLPNPDTGPGVGLEERLGPVLAAAAAPGTTVTATGFAQMLSNAGPNGSNLAVATLIGATLAFLTLLVVYGSAIAVVPILMAVPAIFATFFGVLCLTYVAHVSYFVEYMIALLGLGVATDFSLIIVIRWREERERGLDNQRAIVAACDSAGRAVLLSGVTSAIGLLSLIVLPVPFLRSIGIGTMLIPFVAVAVALTLLPVTLALLGPMLDRIRLWPSSTITYSRAWERWGRFVLRHRRIALFAGSTAVIALAVPALSINTAEPLIGSLSPQGLAAAAFRELQAQGVPSAIDFPIQIIAHGGTDGLKETTSIVLATPGVYTLLSPNTPSFRQGEDSLITVIPTAEGSTVDGKAIVVNLRSRLAHVRGGAEVGGSTAADMSFASAVYGSFPLLLATVSAVSLLILSVALRSIVLAIKAVVLNVISLGAAYGFMVAFWQKGFGSGLLYGNHATGAIRDWIPVVVFASLFGLSMDYEVFLLSRIREEYDRSGSTDDAIVRALARTGRLVTCAAVIMMVSLLSISSDPNQLVKIVSTTLAVGVIVDAVLIRTILVPALVSLMGRWNWWSPLPMAGMNRN